MKKILPIIVIALLNFFPSVSSLPMYSSGSTASMNPAANPPGSANCNVGDLILLTLPKRRVVRAMLVVTKLLGKVVVLPLYGSSEHSGTNLLNIDQNLKPFLNALERLPFRRNGEVYTCMLQETTLLVETIEEKPTKIHLQTEEFLPMLEYLKNVDSMTIYGEIEMEEIKNAINTYIQNLSPPAQPPSGSQVPTLLRSAPSTSQEDRYSPFHPPGGHTGGRASSSSLNPNPGLQAFTGTRNSLVPPSQGGLPVPGGRPLYTGYSTVTKQFYYPGLPDDSKNGRAKALERLPPFGTLNALTDYLEGKKSDP